MNTNQKQFCLGELGKYIKKVGICGTLRMNRILVISRDSKRNRVYIILFLKKRNWLR